MKKSRCCDARILNGLPPLREPRCTGCGHRVEWLFGAPPVQSRELPFWTWPGELIGRWKARHA